MFFIHHGRIPYREEVSHAATARRHFGSWNAAVKVAGFTPNPVLFSKKHRANDGHTCDSLAERIIDDWLYARGIRHEQHTRYPKSSFTSDFKVGDVYIEYFGLAGQLKKYDTSKIAKLQYAKKNGILIIQLFQKDIYPLSRLDEKLGSIFKEMY